MDLNKAHYVVATAIIVKDGKFLITKRSQNEKVFPNLWTVPGGKLELKDYIEKPKDTEDCWYNAIENLLKREVKEETSLEIKNIKYLTSLAFIRPDNIPVVVLSFFADYHDGEIKLSPELTEHAWVTLKEAAKYDLIDGIYEELEMLHNHLNGNSQKKWNKENKNL